MQMFVARVGRFCVFFFFFFFNDTATTEIYTLSLHDALPIYSTGFTKSRFCVLNTAVLHGMATLFQQDLLQERYQRYI